MRTALPLVLLAAGCVPAAPAPAPPPPPPPAPVVVAPRPAPPVAADWRDWPTAPGAWRYAGGTASFGAPAIASLRCSRDARRVTLIIPGGAPGALTVRTTSTARQLQAQASGELPPGAAIALAANDLLLDAMAFSRGHFVVEQPGRSPLVIPAQAEIGRVIEDCRG